MIQTDKLKTASRHGYRRCGGIKRREVVDEQWGKQEKRCLRILLHSQRDTSHHIWPSFTFFFPPLFWAWKLSWKTWRRSELRVLSAVQSVEPSASGIRHSSQRHLRYLRQRGSNLWSRLLSVMYSKAAWVQSSSTQWEVRSPSTPFIHSLIQLEGNYRPPEASRSSSVSVPIREPGCVGSPLDCTGWCLYRCIKHQSRQQQTDKKAFSQQGFHSKAVTTSRFQRLWSGVVYRHMSLDLFNSMWLRRKLLSLWVRNHRTDSFLQSGSRLFSK